MAGLSGARQNAAVALCRGGELVAFSELERVTRVRRAGLEPDRLPAETLDVVLGASPQSARAASTADIREYAIAEPDIHLPRLLPVRRLDHHLAHAATAWYLSPFERAAVMVCDGEGPSVWIGGPSGLARQEWPTGESLANLYSQAAELFTSAPGQEFQLEALARLGNGSDAERLSPLLAYRDGEVVADPEWRTVVGDWLSAGGTSISHRARVASAVQGQLGLLLLAMAADLRARTGQAHLAVGGGLFFNTWFTTLLRQAGVFDDVSVAINPGNAGLAAGAALWTSTGGHRPGNRVSPFLGPTFGAEEIKRTLDNCKLSYECLDENAVVDVAVQALRRGQLVGWFQGRMEWGHRALGHRSILASPLSPYVLDNLNTFLKHRQRHRTYGVSVPESRLADCFEGPPRSRYMEFEYRPRDTARFEALLPDGTSSLRVQSIPETPEPGASPLFRQLHEAFETAAGLPVLVNTSFNAFREPMVCSPRDAIRVFFGTGLDLLVMDRFVIRK